MIRNRPLVAVLCLPGFTLAACNDPSRIATRPIALSVATKPAAATVAGTPVASRLLGSMAPASVMIAPNLTIESVEIVLSELELAKSDGTACTVTTQGSDGDCDDFEMAPFLINTPINSTVSQEVTALVPEGTYAGFDAHIGPVRAGGDGAAAFFAANPGFPPGTSVRVHGTYGTISGIIYSSSLDAGFESTFSPPVVVGGTLRNITLNVDVSQWFIDPVSKAVLDPTNAANASVIDQNIRRSFRAFEDDRMEGVENSR